ncbi:Short-chain dehydrogenase chyC [Fusarium oxysporum f. sp. albedinis]|nr:Short-chain dehydrogenase chyC [Fusarium oxysporum f. sp. albedinis]
MEATTTASCTLLGEVSSSQGGCTYLSPLATSCDEPNNGLRYSNAARNNSSVIDEFIGTKFKEKQGGQECCNVISHHVGKIKSGLRALNMIMHAGLMRCPGQYCLLYCAGSRHLLVSLCDFFPPSVARRPFCTAGAASSWFFISKCS